MCVRMCVCAYVCVYVCVWVCGCVGVWVEEELPAHPYFLQFTVGRYAPRFNGFQQQDAQELLAFVLDGLHEDLNRLGLGLMNAYGGVVNDG